MSSASAKAHEYASLHAPTTKHSTRTRHPSPHTTDRRNVCTTREAAPP